MAGIGRLSGDGQYGDFVDQYLNPVSLSGREVMCVCLFHESSSATLQFNLDSGLFTCFSCGVGGSYRKIEKRLGVDHRDIEVGLDVIYRKLNDLRKGADLDTGPRLMRESELDAFKLPSDHWSARNLYDTTVSAFDLGYDITHDAMTVPLRTMNGDLLGVMRRYCEDDPDMRYRYPKGFHKSDHLFASWMVANDTSVTSVALTEGAIDAMSLWQVGQPAMAIYGSHVSLAQIRIMRMLGLTKLVLFFDNDRAGRELTDRCKGWKKTGGDSWRKDDDLDLRRYFDVDYVDWSLAGGKAKDANDLGVSTMKRMLANAISLG